MTREKRFTCWSCKNYMRKQIGPHEWNHACLEGHHELVPHGTPFDCDGFCYEPGSDQDVSEE